MHDLKTLVSAEFGTSHRPEVGPNILCNYRNIHISRIESYIGGYIRSDAVNHLRHRLPLNQGDSRDTLVMEQHHTIACAGKLDPARMDMHEPRCPTVAYTIKR